MLYLCSDSIQIILQVFEISYFCLIWANSPTWLYFKWDRIGINWSPASYVPHAIVDRTVNLSMQQLVGVQIAIGIFLCFHRAWRSLLVVPTGKEQVDLLPSEAVNQQSWGRSSDLKHENFWGHCPREWFLIGWRKYPFVCGGWTSLKEWGRGNLR